ncbi:hypothetical protein SKAU_G00140590 [Synaphobranchus kaupii]|uniref:IRG-type G domain-containing protein n=1 Tax=Synaphobranchus kaupii TaxID=118154 RepID=A0A9Q1FT76_SYNKA|nr:hypothetical protein SKAU_G00140590 [Synaphobranchus kaupii]
MKSPKVFLISSFNLNKYDFRQLQETMEKELPDHKKCIFLLALPNITQVINEKKKSVLQANIWKIALLSAVVAAVPIPLLGFGVDVFILMREIYKYSKAFGLDEASLRSLAEHVKVPVEELKKATKSGMDQITKDMVIKLLKTAVGGFKVSDTPPSTIACMVAVWNSFYIIYGMLKFCLDELAEDAHRVLVRAFPSEGSE